MFYKTDTNMINYLLCMKEGISAKFDYVLCISGDTGTGKSTLGLHIAEVWQKVINKDVDEGLIKQIHVVKIDWLKKFRNLEEFDISIFDEGATGLSSKSHMEKFSKSLEILFQVIRKKGFFTVLIIPNFFRLNKFFREDRLRGLFYVDKRGHYKYFTRERVVKLCAENENKTVKSLELVEPAFEGNYPDYDGVLKELYEKMKETGVDEVLDEVIYMNEHSDDKKVTLVDAYKDKVKELLDKGKSLREVSEDLELSVSTVHRCSKVLEQIT